MTFDRSVYMFEIDDVLIPKRDYLLQVYYLFANFVEYTEGRELSKELLGYLTMVFEAEGEDAVIPAALRQFELEDSYLENFERLRTNAHLPLKLFLREETKTTLLSLFAAGKKVGILTDGNPVEQLNKLKHIDWQDVSEYLPLLKVYFVKELTFRKLVPLDFIAQDYEVSPDDVEFVTDFDDQIAPM
ncbi:HAD family hydrolase [Sphingobacterium paludis]|uniref:Haloacid dehalogenase-like hydrolase n=1 Tax=Sphingobacterium paludis TaxID=1476465 RepID=A0A4R7D4R5_9SPHI|nr:HAD family hydrolase [Sphingobacterium paludis]TDS15870.1 hypothetical protein B0I21_102187 [Sphingobacterium paludis]